MGTILLFMLLTGNIDWGVDTEELSRFGKIMMIINKFLWVVILFITSLPFALIENAFLFPIWIIYNLCHKKEHRKSYVKFLKNQI